MFDHSSQTDNVAKCYPWLLNRKKKKIPSTIEIETSIQGMVFSIGVVISFELKQGKHTHTHKKIWSNKMSDLLQCWVFQWRFSTWMDCKLCGSRYTWNRFEMKYIACTHNKMVITNSEYQINLSSIRCVFCNSIQFTSTLDNDQINSIYYECFKLNVQCGWQLIPFQSGLYKVGFFSSFYIHSRWNSSQRVVTVLKISSC